MILSLAKTINKIFEIFNLKLVRASLYKKIKLKNLENEKNLFLAQNNQLATSNAAFIIGRRGLTDFSKIFTLLQQMKSQLGQDLLALEIANYKKDGFFVEIGATDGIFLSNTFLLERYGWKGILAEPAKFWQIDLKRNREAYISNDCVWSKSDENLLFSDVLNNAELSTISAFKSSDEHANSRANVNTYSVKSISLVDLLEKFKAPKQIDFLSIDTEGSEFEILSAFDFSKFQFELICVEHNYTEKRVLLKNLLESNGYVQIFPEISKWDDWYIFNR